MRVRVPPSAPGFRNRGLSLVTLQSYTTRGKSNLVRGEDFIVRRVSAYLRQFMITRPKPPPPVGLLLRGGSN